MYRIGDFSKFTHLESLTLNVYNYDYSGIPGKMKTILSHLSSSQLTSIMLRFHTLRVQDLDERNPMNMQVFRECDDILSRPQFSTVQSVSLVIHFGFIRIHLPASIAEEPSSARSLALATSTIVSRLVSEPVLAADPARDAIDARRYFPRPLTVTKAVEATIARAFERLSARGIMWVGVDFREM